MLQKKIAKYAARKDMNCAGFTLCAAVEEYGLDVDPKFADATACFGGGMNIGEVCGAVSGGLMVLGLMFNKDAPYESGNIKRIAQQFLADINTEFGSVACRDLKTTKRPDQTCGATVVPRIASVLEQTIRRELEARK